MCNIHDVWLFCTQQQDCTHGICRVAVLSLLHPRRTVTCLAVIYKKPTWEGPMWKEPFLKRCWPRCTCRRASDNSAHTGHSWLLLLLSSSGLADSIALLAITLYLCTAQVIVCTSLAFHLCYVSFKYLALQFIQGCLYVWMVGDFSVCLSLSCIYHQNNLMFVFEYNYTRLMFYIIYILFILLNVVGSRTVFAVKFKASLNAAAAENWRCQSPITVLLNISL